MINTPLIVISGLCCHKGCKRVPQYAHRVGPEMWVGVCEDHNGVKITLDMDKICAATDATKRLKGKNAATFKDGTPDVGVVGLARLLKKKQKGTAT